MGKRSSYARIDRDCYDTPREAVVPLLPFLPPASHFIEPCAGAYDLAHHLECAGHVCLAAADIAPRDRRVARVEGGALHIDITDPALAHAALFVTNPPWSREVLHPIIAHLSSARPSWILLDADWMHTRQAAPFMDICRAAISVGRVKWFPNSRHSGQDNCAWYLFDAHGIGRTIFVGRPLLRA